MSIFGTIMSKIFGTSHADAAPAAGAAAAGGAPTAATPASTGGAATQTVDVAAVMDAMPGADDMNWRTSIVDLMKLLHMDSSLTARKELAHELKFDGDTDDSATMNIWLHKQVMAKLAANGGKLPDDIKHG